jgi:hypothetical protein
MTHLLTIQPLLFSYTKGKQAVAEESQLCGTQSRAEASQSPLFKTRSFIDSQLPKRGMKDTTRAFVLASLEIPMQPVSEITIRDEIAMEIR